MPTLRTLHLWSQAVGKVRLMLTPWENHGWHVPFYLTPAGFATGMILTPATGFTVEFDVHKAELVVRTSSAGTATLPLAAQSMAEFHRGLLALLSGLGISVQVDPMPNEIAGAIRFDRDHEVRAFDVAVAHRYWLALLQVQRVFQLFRTRFVGKVSPIHLFWGAFDLALTRFSGRQAPRHPGGAPFLDDAVAREAYSHEVSSAGFWPNLESAEGPCFYSYAYPVPPGYAEHPVQPPHARFDSSLGEFILPYAAVQAAADPDRTLLAFLQSTYEAAADAAGWDRSALERAEGGLGRPPAGS